MSPLRASFPMIVLGLIRNMMRGRETSGSTDAIAGYVHRTEEVRNKVAEDYERKNLREEISISSTQVGRLVAEEQRGGADAQPAREEAVGDVVEGWEVVSEGEGSGEREDEEASCDDSHPGDSER